MLAYQTKRRYFLSSQRLQLIQCLHHELNLTAEEYDEERSVERAQVFNYLV